MRICFRPFLFAALIAVFVIVPDQAIAASVEARVARDGALWRVTYILHAEGAALNVLAGTFPFSSDLKVERIETGRSIIQLWVTSPKNDRAGVTFEGVVPGGFLGSAIPSRGLTGSGEIMTAVFSSEKDHGILAGGSIRGYLHDGSGTEVSLPFAEVTFDARTPEESVSDDRTPPARIFFEILNEPSMLVLDAQDKETGIDRYEVKIGRTEWKTVEPPVPLSQAERDARIAVRAFDNAGNFREALVQESSPNETYKRILGIIGILVIVLVLAAVYMRVMHRE